MAPLKAGLPSAFVHCLAYVAMGASDKATHLASETLFSPQWVSPWKTKVRVCPYTEFRGIPEVVEWKELLRGHG